MEEKKIYFGDNLELTGSIDHSYEQEQRFDYEAIEYQFGIVGSLFFLFIIYLLFKYLMQF